MKLLVLAVCLVFFTGDAKSEMTDDCADDTGKHQENTGAPPPGELNNIPEFVQLGFLDYEGAETIFTQFDEVNKVVKGFSSKRSPNGMLVSGKKRNDLEIVTAVYASNDGYVKVCLKYFMCCK